jgi:hypothetical protein
MMELKHEMDGNEEGMHSRIDEDDANAQTAAWVREVDG